MNETELRALIRESNLQPVRTHMDDRTAYPITHPDYAVVSDIALPFVSGPGMDVHNAHFAICYFDHIAHVEVPKKRPKVAA